MKLTREELGRALSRELDKGYDPIRIAKWAFLLHLDTTENDPGVDSELSDLMLMEEPEFVMSEKELRELAHTLQGPQ
jgi:hypothetical protein